MENINKDNKSSASRENQPQKDGSITSHSPVASQLGINFTFFVIYMACISAFGSFVNDMYLPSFPSMMKFFGCSISMVQLGLTTGMIGLGLGQLILGPISDKYGRKPVLLYSLILFIIAAVVSIFSPTIHFFLICRLFQGLGASGGYFLARTIPADVFTGRPLAKTMAIIGAINGFAPACAPVVGGFISARFDWKGVFVALAIFSVILLIFLPRLKETLLPARRASGSVFNSFKNYKLLLDNKPFITHVFLKGAGLSVLFAYISSAPFIIQTHYGFSQVEFGLIVGGNAVLVAAGAMVALRFKLLKKAALIGGIFLMVSVLVEAAALLWIDTFLSYELLLLPMLFCMGMIFTVGNTLAMNEGRSHAGDASAIVGIMGYIFGAVVSPLVGIGDIMKSTAIVFLVCAFIVLIFSILSSRLAPDLNQPAKG